MNPQTEPETPLFQSPKSLSSFDDGQALRDDKGRRLQDTEWHRITCFNGLGKTVQQYCDTGMKVLVRGRIHYTKWKDQQGNDRYGCEIIAETVDFLSRARQTQSENGDRFEDDDIPF
ncbi:single-stranded DNA-binding protein [Shinella sp. NM-101]|uniref:single-stranded DNA-binding protein n=1 Tax=Shinella sp. NM-101 TaxID=2744455 RepID=UPI00351D1CB6